MANPDENSVRTVLKVNGRDGKIQGAIRQAWLDVVEKYPDRGAWRRKSTVRSLMWEHSVDRVMEVVADDPGLICIPHKDTASFIADDQVLFRLKKANRKLVSSNYPTLLAETFYHHEEDLFGHEGLQRVEIVHTFSKFQTGLDFIGVVARTEGKVLWHFELDGAEAEIISFPSMPAGSAGKSVIRPIMSDTDVQVKE